MQAYDSVFMDVDGEVGGNDQTFNMLAGRDLMKSLKNKEKFVLTLRLLADPSGKKMGKSEGNMVALADSPEDMFGKVMSWGDGMILGGFELCTRLPVEEIKAIEKELAGGVNPRDIKVKLASEIVKTFLGEEAAKKGEEYFVHTFSKKEIPDEIPEITPSVYDVITVLTESKICKSKSEARQNIDQGGVKINEIKVEAKGYMTSVKSGDVVQKGSRFFVKVK
jgi:tyrosyl-tRNA synthetase